MYIVTNDSSNNSFKFEIFDHNNKLYCTKTGFKTIEEAIKYAKINNGHMIISQRSNILQTV